MKFIHFGKMSEQIGFGIKSSATSSFVSLKQKSYLCWKFLKIKQADCADPLKYILATDLASQILVLSL
jgi:hypothetical protein